MPEGQEENDAELKYINSQWEKRILIIDHFHSTSYLVNLLLIAPG